MYERLGEGMEWRVSTMVDREDEDQGCGISHLATINDIGCMKYTRPFLR